MADAHGDGMGRDFSWGAVAREYGRGSMTRSGPARQESARTRRADSKKEAGHG